jgi:hypothetical protein
MENLKNYHALTIGYVGATNHRGSRIRIKSDRFEQSILIPYDYEFSNTLEGAQKYLIDKGFNLVGQGELKDAYLLLTDTFKPLK